MTEFSNLSDFAIPGIGDGKLIACPVTGESMTPVIHNTDIVIGKQIEMSEAKDNEIHLIFLKGKSLAFVKYIQIDNKRGKLKLISANYLEFDPFEIDLSEISAIYKVIRRIPLVCNF